MKTEILKKYIPNLILFIGFLTYLSLIFNNNVWMDEAFSACLVRNVSLKECLEASANDTLPPLYNILNWLFTNAFGFSAAVLKITSVLSMTGCLILSSVCIKKRFGNFASVCFSLCLCAMPSFLYYGVEIRMYALGMFFVTASGCMAIEAFYTSKPVFYILLSVFTLGAGYTHHFALVSAGFVYFFLFISIAHKNKSSFNKLLQASEVKYFFFSVLITAVGYIPCLLTTLKQMKKVGGYFSMPDITPQFIVNCIKMPFITGITILSLTVMVCYFFILIYTAAVKGCYSLCLGFIIFLSTLCFGCVATLLFSANIFTDRYLVPSLGLFWLSFSLMASRLKEIPRTLVIILLLICFIHDYHTQYDMEYSNGVNEMISYFNANIPDNSSYLIYEDNYQIEICFRYYFPSLKKIKLKNLTDIPQNAETPTYYVMVPGYENNLKKITAAGYKTEYLADFYFDRYSFKLFKLL